MADHAHAVLLHRDSAAISAGARALMDDGNAIRCTNGRTCPEKSPRALWYAKHQVRRDGKPLLEHGRPVWRATYHCTSCARVFAKRFGLPIPLADGVSTS